MYIHTHTHTHSLTHTHTEGDRSLGMVIVSGKVRNKDGSTVEGIFIQKILPGSLTDKDGRYIICTEDDAHAIHSSGVHKIC